MYFVKEYCKKYKLNLKDIAIDLGISRYWLYKKLNYKVYLSPTEKEKIYQFFKKYDKNIKFEDIFKKY